MQELHPPSAFHPSAASAWDHQPQGNGAHRAHSEGTPQGTLQAKHELPKAIFCALTGLKQHHLKCCHGNGCLEKTCDGGAHRMAEHAEVKGLTARSQGCPTALLSHLMPSTQQPQVEAAIPHLESWAGAARSQQEQEAAL